MLPRIALAACAAGSLLLSSTAVHAQFRYANTFFEAGVSVGVMNYSGELTNTIMDLKHLHLGVGVFGRYTFHKFVTLRLQASFGTVSGDDRNSKTEANRYRNLNFRSPLFEGAIMGEFNLLGYHPGHEKKFSPFLFFGVGIFSFNPKGRHFDGTPGVAGTWIPLRDLHTEGQNSSIYPNLRPYKRVSVSLPMGAGIKFAVHSNLNIGLEIGFRKTFTDYMDDVSGTYMYDPLTQQYAYPTGNPYREGYYGNKSLQELMSDRTWEYIAIERGESLATMNFNSDEVLSRYQQLNAQRGGHFRGVSKNTDWYVFTAAYISYNFIDSGLVGARKRRKSKAGCKSSKF